MQTQWVAFRVAQVGWPVQACLNIKIQLLFSWMTEGKHT